MPKYIVGPDHKMGKTKVMCYNTLTRMVTRIKQAVKANNRKKFIHAYWPQFDSLLHKFGVHHMIPEMHFAELHEKIYKLATSLQGTNTKIIITADHGQINRSRFINLDKHPKVRECLSQPLSGEWRFAYAYVKPGKTKQFEQYIKTKLKKYCTLHKSADLIKKGYFGLFKPHNALEDRTGDYTLIMKEHYIIEDVLPHQEPTGMVGVHGGVTKEEMEVPLIVINC